MIDRVKKNSLLNQNDICFGILPYSVCCEVVENELVPSEESAAPPSGGSFWSPAR